MKSFSRDKVVYPEEMNRLYKEVPEEFRGKGTWRIFGQERLFSPFQGLFHGGSNKYDWKCDKCGCVSFWSWVKENKYRCFRCKAISHKWVNGK